VGASAVDIGVLFPLVSAGKENDDSRACQSVIDPIAWPEIDFQLPNTVATKSVVAEVVQFNSVDSAIDGNSGFHVSQALHSLQNYVIALWSEVMANLAQAIIVYKRKRSKSG